MSTRSTIAYGNCWHLYEEVLDGTIHLELEQTYNDWGKCIADIIVRGAVLEQLMSKLEIDNWTPSFPPDDRPSGGCP